AAAEHIHGDPAAIPALSLYQTQAVNNGGYFTATTVQDILLARLILILIVLISGFRRVPWFLIRSNA
ncbi:MAG: hypothetical protein IIY06_06245, partial [Proteobacteria bacterium]|nr:hypothetical protein [Pseudomonadota bacterium]